MFQAIEMILTQQFLLRALIVGVLISLCCALLGVSLVLKRFSMIGDGLSHVGFGAMAIATAANIAPLYFALPIVIISAFLLLRMSEKGRIKGDAAIALISTGALAIGIMVTSVTTGINVDIYNYMFGSILTMSGNDVVVSCVLAFVVLLLFIIFHNEIFAVTFDESFAKATGTKTSLYNMLIAMLTAVTIVIGMKMMGAMLISSLIIFPTVTSMRVCKSYRKVLLCSCAVSVFCFLIGLLLSIKFDTPTGASVVCFNIFLLLVFTLIQKIGSSNKSIGVKNIVKTSLCVFSALVVAIPFFAVDVTNSKKDKTTIVATTFAQYDFARQIVGDKANVIMLLSPGEESHTYEPAPSDIATIENCDVFVYGGGESEKWVDEIITATDSNFEIVRMMDVISLYKEESHEHSQNEHVEHNHKEEYDEHVWTSPLNAIEIVKAISKAIISKDAVNSSFYKENTEKYILELQKLDDELMSVCKNAKRNYIVVGDRFPLRYFTERYNLNYFAAFSGCSAQVEASPATVAELIEKVTNENINTVFKVDLNTGNVAYSISEATQASVETLYSCHVISSDDFKNGETYISLMKRNLEALKKALY